MTRQPLAEVFGFPINNMSWDARRYRKNRLCPFGNKVPSCTKDKANNPIGVCSILTDGDVVITCPIRFRQGWIVAEDAASFFFPPETKWTTLTEVRLQDKNGQSAGNVDVVLVAYNAQGRVVDFGALEVQAVYISGNIRNPFEYYMDDAKTRQGMDWSGRPNYPRPDYLSSSRKRLAPQLIFKGGIFKAWNKKTAVALSEGFFNTLPPLEEVDEKDADIAWLVYRLGHDEGRNLYALERHKVVHTRFDESLDKITRSEPGDIRNFIELLQEKMHEKLENGYPPDTETIDAPF